MKRGIFVAKAENHKKNRFRICRAFHTLADDAISYATLVCAHKICCLLAGKEMSCDLICIAVRMSTKHDCGGICPWIESKRIRVLPAQHDRFTVTMHRRFPGGFFLFCASSTVPVDRS